MRMANDLPYTPNPERERLINLALNLEDGFLYGPSGPFAARNRLSLLHVARTEATYLDASIDYLNRFNHVIRSVETLDRVKRWTSLREAQLNLERDIPRMSGSAGWPGQRAQLDIKNPYHISLTAKFYERPGQQNLVDQSAIVPAPVMHSSVAEPGDQVTHEKFGDGHVLSVEGNKLTVSFETVGEKRLVDTFVKRI